MHNNVILAVNAGSSSLKLDLFDEDSLEHTFGVAVTNIGQPNAAMAWEDQTKSVAAATHTEAVAAALNLLAEQQPELHIAAVGHRLVHGGERFSAPTALTAGVLAQLQELAAFDPEHMPVALELVEHFGQTLPGVPQIGCFDTAFYRDLPAVARLLPLPRKFTTLGLRRYGFHGLSYESLLARFKETAGETAAHGRIILAHLGSGASLTVVKSGQPLDTTMSFTPASGIPMSSRSGDLDPGIAYFLQKQTGMTSEEFNHMVHFESGLLGVSGLSPDMELLLKEQKTNPQAAEAVELFCYQVRKIIAGLTAVLGGLDSLIFAGGIGEHAPLIRAAICHGLEYLGIELDEQRNNAHDFLISAHTSAVGVHVVHANEALTIAQQTKQTIIEQANA